MEAALKILNEHDKSQQRGMRKVEDTVPST